jgi:tRNA(fMet)-specific endonuclease VapC
VADLVVVDTDLIVDFLRGRGFGSPLVRELLQQRRLRLTAITAFELSIGADFLARRGDILRLVRRRTFAVDGAAAIRAGEIAAELRSAGQEIGFADCLQAGVCLRHDLPLATRNRRHLERVAGLRLVNPAESPSQT